MSLLLDVSRLSYDVNLAIHFVDDDKWIAEGYVEESINMFYSGVPGIQIIFKSIGDGIWVARVVQMTSYGEVFLGYVQYVHD